MNISLKSKVRHWFNFYRLALESTDPVIIKNIQKSKDFYESWGDVQSISFDEWWKIKSHLFHERQTIEVLSGTFKTDENALFLKVPLTFSAIAASKYFARLYREEYEKKVEKSSKVKKKYLGQFNLTPIEFQTTNFFYYSIFAKKVYTPLYLKTGKQPVTKDIIHLAKKKFENLSLRTEKKSREIEKQRIAPFRQSIEHDYASLSRTATRYRLIAENLIKNASLGIFPGNYQEKGVCNLSDKRKKIVPSTIKLKVGRKRIARPIGYKKKSKIIDQDNPNDRKMYVK
jgi:hypothetical protein